MTARYLKRRKENVEGRFCACGNPAVKWIRGAYGCQRCIDIEERLYVRVGQIIREEKPYENEMEMGVARAACSR